VGLELVEGGQIVQGEILGLGEQTGAEKKDHPNSWFHRGTVAETGLWGQASGLLSVNIELGHADVNFAIVEFQGINVDRNEKMERAKGFESCGCLFICS
jgi:hypothetical protein